MTAACGSSSKKSAASSDTTAAPSTTVAPTTTTTAPDPQADAAKAKQINLQASDFPAGWTSTPATAQTAQDQADADQLRACLGQPPKASVQTADEQSADFNQGEINVSSSVSFVKSTDIAKQELAAFKSDKAVGCIKDSLNAAVTRSAQGATISNVSVTALPGPSKGDGGFGFHFTATVSGGGQQATVTAEMQGVLVGRAEISYTTFSLGTQTVPDSLSADLIGKMVARAG